MRRGRLIEMSSVHHLHLKFSLFYSLLHPESLIKLKCGQFRVSEKYEVKNNFTVMLLRTKRWVRVNFRNNFMSLISFLQFLHPIPETMISNLKKNYITNSYRETILFNDCQVIKIWQTWTFLSTKNELPRGQFFPMRLLLF